MFAWLTGKKTYIVAVLSLLGAVGAYFGGSLDAAGLFYAVEIALTAMGLRSAITTTPTP